MNNVVQANITDLDKVVYIDSEVIGNTSRRRIVKNAIDEKRCLIVKEMNDIVGFLIYDTHFFECSFISLIIVSPSKRRKGYASQLIDYMMSHSPTTKVFSSTNRSNERMKLVFEKKGFSQSGIIENLDEGDPEIIYYKTR
ncbi:GNAT family N-acetyltransferase [Bacillus spongiae]|uniref:GNAT family N-acetyltransferase n=1 Tax=Bacillus spongiae TaxID=2683610 RepID=A0ABU8HF63_9BACI